MDNRDVEIPEHQGNHVGKPAPALVAAASSITRPSTSSTLTTITNVNSDRATSNDNLSMQQEEQIYRLSAGLDDSLSTDAEMDSESSDIPFDKTLSTDSEESDEERDGDMPDSSGISAIHPPSDAEDVNQPGTSRFQTSTPRTKKRIPPVTESATDNPTKKRHLYLPSPVEVIQSEDCCANRCKKKLTFIEIEEAQRYFQESEETSTKQEILRQIGHQTKLTQTSIDTISCQFNFVIRGKYVCQDAWRYVFNVSLRKFNDCLDRLRAGHKNVIHGNAGGKRPTLKTTQARAWMKTKFNRIGDYMPDCDKIKLPQTSTKKRLYEEMRGDFLERGIREEEIVSYQYFTQLWTKSFHNVSISDGSTFTTCSQCQVIKDMIATAKTDTAAETAKNVLESHELMVEAERAAYHAAREEAAQGDRVTTIIIDGMDQAKTNLPHIVPKDKKLEPLAKLPTHVTGCLIHCSLPGNKVPLVFIDHKHIPHDPNLTMNVLMRALEMYEQHLGKTLFLQLDNCFRENKNRFFLSFASLLVQYEIFQEVTVHFLPVGHTHEDIDQMFSRISVKLARNMAYTITDFVTLVEEAYTPIIKVYEACPVFNIKEWMDEHLESTMTGHSKPLWFRFRQAAGAVRMQWRKYVTTPWMPQPQYEEDGTTMKPESYGYKCLKTIPDVADVPNYVKPTLDRLDASGLSRDLPNNYKDRMPSIAQDWWQEYIDKINNLVKVPRKPTTWVLQTLAGHSRQVHDDDVILPAPIQRIQEALEETTPQVVIGRQGRPLPAARVQTVGDYDGVQAGMLVAVHLEDETPPPYIGRVLTRNANEIEVEWYKGGYNKKWVPWMQGAGKNYRNISATKLDVSSCLLWDFSLTSQAQKLPGAVVEELKKKYAELMK